MKVFGHPRSGNHLLAALLHEALFPHLEPLIVPNKNTGHWTKRQSAGRYCVDGKEQEGGELAMPYGKLVGSHVLPYQADLSKQVVYIYRDGRDVAVSFWNWKKFHSTNFPKTISFEEYIRAEIDWRGSPGWKWDRHDLGYGLFDHWRDHVEEWLMSGVFCVRYEELVADPKPIIEAIAERYGLEIVGDSALPGPVGWNPSMGKARVGAWREMFSSALVELFDERVPKDHPGRWEV